jgi:hypothetical protein
VALLLAAFGSVVELAAEAVFMMLPEAPLATVPRKKT